MPIYSSKNLLISPDFCLALSLVLLILPLRWVCGWLAAAVIHELCHYIALKMCGVEVYRITLGLNGAVMETAPMSSPKELLCAIAGPIGGWSIALLGRWIPCTAICAVFHSLYNLLPIYPLDGGRALSVLLQVLLDHNLAFRVQKVGENIILFLLLILSTVACLYLKTGLLPFLCVGMIFIKNRQIKFPCKHSKQIVQ